MPYLTQQELIDRFGSTEITQLADRDGDGVIDQAVIDGAIADADAEIDGYLQSRYELPLGSVPRVIERIAADLARYFLYDDHATEHVNKRRDDAVKFLKSVSKGEVALGLSESGDPAKPADQATMESDGRTFGRNDGSFI